MRKLNNRDYAIMGVFALIFFVFIIRFGYFQIVRADDYENAGKSVSSRSVTVKSTRGEILDRNGYPLVTNRQGNAVIFDASNKFPSYEQQKERNKIILKLIRLFEKADEEWIDNLPIEVDKNGNVLFEQDREEDIAAMKSRDRLNLNSYATAENCLDALIERYSLQEYSKADACKIASVCYEMLLKSFNASNPYTFADDVSDKLVSIIKENSVFLPGVDIEITTYREYTDGSVAPHIIGMTGVISAEEYEEKKDTYGMTDIIGKNGIELAMETYLKGKNGLKTYYSDASGETRVENTVNPEQGNNIILTLDYNLQKVAQDAVKNCLDTFENKGTPPAGSAVVIKVDTGEVLAAATYPSYNVETYNKNYKKLVKNVAAPLWNRAFLSTYVPGSTMKPAISIAGLEEGVITSKDGAFCNSKYTYKDITLGCTGAHGFVNVVSAIHHSCNIFYYQLGEKLGISTMNKYRKILGFAQKTGIEIEEASGTLDSPSYRQTLGQEWYPGFTLQSAIGNAGDQTTPIQLANYCATIANGGTRYKCTLIKSIKSYDYSTTIMENEPVVAAQTGISQSTLRYVREGMLLVGTEGACQPAFSTLPVKAAAKTGTSQVERVVDGTRKICYNGFLITYAPYDDPEIAVCVALEGAGSGASVAPVARDIFAYYFNEDKDAENNTAQDELYDQYTDTGVQNEDLIQ
ncbi:MAG: penicillin-binding protein [Clostridia bacterium]|nr:penicillin-binding protein [Clostridia bacterium]